MKNTIIRAFAITFACLSIASAEEFLVYSTAGNSGAGVSETVNADSFGDAKALYESKNPRRVVYLVKRTGAGEPREINYMSYNEAYEIANGKNR